MPNGSTIPSTEALRKQYVRTVYDANAVNIVLGTYQRLRNLHVREGFTKEPLHEAIANGTVDEYFMSIEQFQYFCGLANIDQQSQGVEAIGYILKTRLNEQNLMPAITLNDEDQAHVVLIPRR
ncbi:hypothetical protein J0I05_02150 [Candidatus Saccharibacteria bacterium]|nr:hypothetical protein [Candidatus Saccharibacteria bacterium]